MSALDGHVLIVSAAGSFTASGRRLTGPVSDIDKLETLLDWAAGRGLLTPRPGIAGGEQLPGRVWVVGTAWALLAGHSLDGSEPAAADPESVRTMLSHALGALAAKGWELRGSRGGPFTVSRVAGGKRLSVELVVEPAPWLAAGDTSVGQDAVELGRRMTAWTAELAVLPAPSPAGSGAVLLEAIMGARAGRKGGGAVLDQPGGLPDGVHPDPRILPEWVASTDQAELAFTHAEDLVLLGQEMGLLASAGMVTLGYGQPRTHTGADAAAAAASAKRDRKSVV